MALLLPGRHTVVPHEAPDERDGPERRSWWLRWVAPAIGVSVIAQWLSIRHGWFYLDDVRNLGEARRDGLGIALLTDPIAEHFTPGHRLLDWLVAVPLRRSWAASGVISIGWVMVALCYLSLTLERLYGPTRRMAIPVLLAGTSVPLLQTEQWFAAAAHLMPAIACMAGAIYHHIRWRTADEVPHGAVALLWTAAGFAFSFQSLVLPAFLVTVALVALDRPLNPRLVGREALAALPAGLVGIGFLAAAKVFADPAETRTLAPTSLPRFLDVARVVEQTLTKSVVPAFAGVGADSSGSLTTWEAAMVTGAAILLLVGVLAGWWLGHRWAAALALFGVGVVVTAAANATARLSIISVTEIATTPRYQLPAVLMASVALGALLTSGRSPRQLPRAQWAPLAIGAVVIAGAIIYSTNQITTFRRHRVGLDFGKAGLAMTQTVEGSLAQLEADGLAGALVDGPLPYPLWYEDPRPTNRLHEWGHFFDPDGVATLGIPTPEGHRFRISPKTGQVEVVPPE